MREAAVKAAFNGGQLGLRLGWGLALLLLAQWVHGASAVHKCVINGSVTFQSSPCAVEKPSRHPTVDELNALRKKRLAEAALVAASAPLASPALPRNGSQNGPQNGPQAGSKPAVPRPSNEPTLDPGFRCDGRQHCTQMRSCGEAKYFLANCPGVKMDGDGDGIPCEQQWCTGPFTK